MVRIEYTDEIDLQKKICEILNKSGYKFEKGPNNYFCDIYDLTIRAYGEVKLNGSFAPQQLLYGLGRESIKNAQYLILANEFELRVYKCPSFKTIYDFAINISSDLSRNPSSIIELNYKAQAFEILGKPVQIYFYDTPFKVDSEIPIRFVDEKNYEYIQAIFNKYRINPSEFINKFANTWSNGPSLFIKNDRKTIVDKESQIQLEAKRKIEQFDVQFIESIRIKPEDIGGIIHKMDTLAPLDIRRKGGKFWTNVDLAEITKQLIE